MKITAVIPAYNHARFLPRAIESVCAQTGPVEELIVVDDGSTDNTREVVARFGDRVRYIYQENRGLSAARNTGLRAASNPWVALLDADDWWLPEKTSRQLDALREKPQAALIYTSAWVVNPDGTRVLDPRTVPPARLWPALRCGNLFSVSGVLLRVDAALAMGGFNERLRACEDWDMWARLALRHPFAAVLEPVTMIANTPGSMSTDPERMLTAFEMILENTLLVGLDGVPRDLWRRRIRACQLFGASVSARHLGPAAERRYLLRSLRQWPSPLFLPKRLVALFRNLLGARRYERLRRRS